MKKISIVLFVTMVAFKIIAQENAPVEVDTTTLESDYREDQFYVSITYNLLGKKPDGVSQSGFSSGFHAGFVRDFPINERRNVAIGIGAGLSTNSYNQTLRIMEPTTDSYSYSILNDGESSFTKNKFTTYILEFPIQFRWRTSTSTTYEFWRVYTGIKLGYVFYNTSKFEGDPNNEIVSNIKDFERLQYGLTLSVGYDKINFYVYYTLNDMFTRNAKIDTMEIGMNAVKIGLIFYIL